MSQRKIAILGGGMSALATAYHLTNQPDWQTRWDITVYQQGWRLGGKCAAGRNIERGWRIEEHGLHVLFGWYENTFRLIRGCYQETGQGDWRRAFRPCHTLVAPEWLDGVVEPWVLRCATNDQEPGDGVDQFQGKNQIISHLYAWVRAWLRGVFVSGRRSRGPEGEVAATLDQVRASIAGIAGADGAESPEAVLALPTLAERLTALSSEWSQPDSDDAHALGFVTDELRARIRDDRFWYDLDTELEHGEPVARGGGARTTLRRLRIFVDFIYTVARGLHAELPADGNWFALDGADLRDWLCHWGADETTVRSALVEAIYAAVFSSGIPGQAVGAGTILQVALRGAFYFKGAVVYQPNGAIADVLFAPLYRTLRQRGVKFAFFHRVEELVPSADYTRIASIRVARQARLGGGRHEYDPLVRLDEQEVWPAAPRYEQLADADTLAGHDLESWWDPHAVAHEELHAGKDFDLVVFGISVGAMRDLMPRALDAPNNDRLRWMAQALTTTQTQAMQLWFEARRDVDGWPGDLPRAASIAIPYQMPFDTVADMQHILAQERWRTPPARLLYLCAALPDDELPAERGDRDYPARQLTRVRRNGAAWLARFGAPLLRPHAAAAPLLCGDDAGDREWLERQYFNAPVNKSDRYVLIPPGSNRFRLRADESGYQNLFLAGDWTLTAVSAGCLEGATLGGIQAARAIDAAVPKAVGDWLPDRAPAPAVAAPALVCRDGDFCAQPPIAIPRLDLYAFVLPADPDALGRLCAAHLNLAPGLDYRPLGPLVLFYAASLTNRAAPFGSAEELDFGFWVPLTTPCDRHDRRLVVYSPYVWVDSSWALAAGRELFGFPKHLGALDFSPDTGRFALSAGVVPRRGGTLEQRPLLEMRSHSPPRRAPALAAWAALVGACTRLGADLLRHEPRVLERWLGRSLRQPSLPMVFLKQLAGAGADRRPAYRAIIESSIDVAPEPCTLTPLAGAFELRVHEYESHRIAATLGLDGADEPDGVRLVRPTAQLHLRFAAVVQPGVEVWREC